MVDKEYEARLGGRRKPTSELSSTDDDCDGEDGDASDDDDELPDLPLQASASWLVASLSPKKAAAQDKEAYLKTPPTCHGGESKTAPAKPEASAATAVATDQVKADLFASSPPHQDGAVSLRR